MVARCKVGDCVFTNYRFLTKLAKTKSIKKRQILIKKASPCEMAALSECCYNVVKANFHLTPARVRKLKKHAPIIREMANVRTPVKGKEILQKGDGFPFAALLAPILLEAGRAMLNI